MFYYLYLGGNVKFSDLVRELGKAADEWDNLGIHLEVPLYIIQRIQKETNSAIQSLTKLLTWLEGNTKISWNKVVQALCIVNKRELARVICLKYCEFSLYGVHVERVYTTRWCTHKI